MIKQIMIALVLIVGLSGVGGADFHIPPENEYNESSHGFGTYSASDCYTTSGSARGLSFRISKGEINTIQVYYSGVITECNATCSTLHVENACFNRYTKAYLSGQKGDAISGNFTTGRHPYYYNYIRAANYYSYGCGWYSKQSWSLTISETLIDRYKVSGNRVCSGVDLYHKDSLGTYTLINYTDYTTESTPYEFINLLNGSDYRLSFVGHNYDFTCTGDEIYNYDICNCITVNFYDRCETPVKNLQLFYWTTTYSTVMSTTVDGSVWEELVFGSNVEIGDTVYIIPIWYDGTQKYTFVASETPMQMDITNIPITYEMGVKTVTEAGAPISSVQVSISQSCAYDGTKNKVTSGGWAWFTGCSNTGGSLTVSKSGYKSATMPFPTLMGTAWDYRTSYIISMVIDGSANDTTGDFNDTIIDISEVVNPDQEYDLDDNNSDLHDGVEIWFIDENGIRTTQVSDTDTYVDLWFVNKNSNESSMTLEFQQSYTGNYYWDNLNWTIAYKKFGFKRIYNVNFIPYYYYYRGKIYNDSLLQWDRIRYLDVRNETKEEEEHYENLSTCLWFRYATIDHKIDYRNDIEIVCNAASNNTTLLDLDIELYNGSVLVDYINLTWADFSGASIKWFYIWKPDYDYASGYNYTTKMIGYNDYVLRTDHVDCFAEDRKNKLTINVKNQYGTDLDNCFVFLEGWGSLPTGSNNYNAYEGLSNGYYRFKATKPDYAGTGWDDITLSDSDEVVTYTLTATDSEEGSATQPQKMDANELQNIYLIIMAFLLIFIIIGGLKYAL